MSYGVIYIVRNPRLGEGVVKVGKSNRLAEDRIKELNSPSSNLGRFELIAAFPVFDVDRAERDCHVALSEFREQANREFFSGDLRRIIAIVEAITKEYEPQAVVTTAFDLLGQRGPDPTRSISERRSDAENRRAREAAAIAEEAARGHQAASELSFAARAALANALLAEGELLGRIPHENATVIDCPGLDADFLSLLTQHIETGQFVPVVETRLHCKGGSSGTILALKLLLAILRLSPTAAKKVRDLGRIVEGTPTLFLLVLAPEPTNLAPFKVANNDKWIVGNERCALSYPLHDAEEATDKFLQAVADSYAIEARRPEASETCNWDDEYPFGLAPRGGRRREWWRRRSTT